MSSPSPYQFEVRVSTQFLEEQSDKDKGPYVFAYTIEIEMWARELRNC
jgi:ApaG protein